MKAIDMHIHMMSQNQNPPDFLARLDAANIDTAAVFSLPPFQYDDERGAAYERRMELLQTMVGAAEGRLLPVLWVHPREPGALDIIKDAAAKGVAGFKIICNNFHVYEEDSLAFLAAIAELGKPVCFHSGILWDTAPSSQYNRPLDFEYLITVPNLRFSLAHCSWPWYDECLALYGKFLTVGQSSKGRGTEMFFDLTPGTPAIYRKDLLFKLLNCGYDTTHNMMFGTDCRSEEYNSAWSAEWQQRDNEIYEELGVQDTTRRLIFRDNARRFFGLSGEKFTPKRISMDGSV